MLFACGPGSRQPRVWPWCILGCWGWGCAGSCGAASPAQASWVPVALPTVIAACPRWEPNSGGGRAGARLLIVQGARTGGGRCRVLPSCSVDEEDPERWREGRCQGPQMPGPARRASTQPARGQGQGVEGSPPVTCCSPVGWSPQRPWQVPHAWCSVSNRALHLL